MHEIDSKELEDEIVLSKNLCKLHKQTSSSPCYSFEYTPQTLIHKCVLDAGAQMCKGDLRQLDQELQNLQRIRPDAGL